MAVRYLMYLLGVYMYFRHMRVIITLVEQQNCLFACTECASILYTHNFFLRNRKHAYIGFQLLMKIMEFRQSSLPELCSVCVRLSHVFTVFSAERYVCLVGVYLWSSFQLVFTTFMKCWRDVVLLYL